MLSVSTPTSSQEPASNRRGPQIIASLIVIGFTLLIYLLAAPLPDEDAYITYVFAESLLRGDGLTYYGVRVEGYTNLLMVLFSSAAAWLSGLSVAAAGHLLSLGFHILATWICFQIALDFFRRSCSPIQALILAAAGTFIINLNPYIVYWHLSGMENSLLAACLLGAVLLYIRRHDRLFILLISLAPLIRYDALLLTLAMSTFLLATLIIADHNNRNLRALWHRRRLIIGTYGATLLPFIGSQIFRWFYYGALTPNTSYMKFFGRDPGDRIFEGCIYLWNSLWSSKSIFLLIFAGFFLLIVRKRISGALLLIICMILVTFAQIVFVGGDVFWKPYYRFATLPTILILLLFLAGLAGLPQRIRIEVLALVLLMIAIFKEPMLTAIPSTYVRTPVTTYIVAPNEIIAAFQHLGKLDALFDRRYRDITTGFIEDELTSTGLLLRDITQPDDLLLTSAAGKAVYYAGLRTIDVSGLADRDWLHGDQQTKQQLFAQTDIVVIHTQDSYCYYQPYLRNRQFSLQAVVLSTQYLVLPMLIFGQDIPTPAQIGLRNIYRPTMIELGGRPIPVYMDVYQPDIPGRLQRKYAEWTSCPS